MSFLDSVKSHMHKDDFEEEEFERAFREGRFPEGVEDFEPLSTTGSFVAANVEVEPEPQRRGTRSQYEGGLYDEGVQVFDRSGEPARFAPTAAVKPEPFAARLRARVAAANVSGQEDELLGRSKVATGATQGSLKPLPDPATTARQRQADEEAEEHAFRAASREAASRRGASDARPQAKPAWEEPAADEPAERAKPTPPDITGVGEARVRPAASLRKPEPTRIERTEVASERTDGASESAERPSRATRSSRASQKAAAKPLALPTAAVVLRPRLYDDVQEIAEGVVGRHQPVILVMRGSSGDVARRILDFSFGLCCGIQAEMRQLGDRVYAIVPRGCDIAEADLVTLRHQGVLRS